MGHFFTKLLLGFCGIWIGLLGVVFGISALFAVVAFLQGSKNLSALEVIVVLGLAFACLWGAFKIYTVISLSDEEWDGKKKK